MSTFAIGDVHGCFSTLEALFDRLEFDEENDDLWMVGDLINRGPRSLDALRWAKRMSERLGSRFVVVLGNHELHLLAADRGWAKERGKDTLGDILAAPDRDELVAWVARWPVLHRQGDRILVHAGLLPEWTAEQAEKWARRVESGLAKPKRARELLRRAGKGADTADPEWRALGALTRLRALTATGEFCDYTGPPDETPVGCTPWFRRSDRKTRDQTIVAGHWAANGLRLEPGLVVLDSGAFWGGLLSAVRLDDGEVYQQPNLDQ
ncbi:MAG: symmetrical bis(5'-nucleosyl)-tetraphosphatase [Deltaproteobacteria bacterium]|nr:symmetrical bis(5'-nucleosyl)-tetraphosphatase [Deltaproteobacteria bacterium]